MNSTTSDHARSVELRRSPLRRCNRRRAALAAAALALAAGLAAPARACSSSAHAVDDMLDRIQAILADAAPDTQVDLLVALGPEAVPQLLDALVGLPADVGVRATKDPRWAPLFDALCRFEIGALRTEAERRVRGGFEERQALVQVMRYGARAQDTDLILKLAAPEGLAPLHAFFIAEEARQSLAALFRRDPPSTGHISWLVRDAHPSHITPILEATSALPPLARISILVDALRDRPAFAPQLLGWLSLVHGERWELPEADSAEVVRPYLAHEDASIVAAAARSLGVLDDHDAVESLIALLVREEAPVREAAHDALRAMTGLALPPEEARWRRWYEAEADWRQRHAQTALAMLNSQNRGVRTAALQEIGRHRLDRHTLAQAVVELMSTADEATVELACVTLRELGSPVAAGGLIWLLDGEGELRSARAAHACLCAITGLKLPPDPTPWSAAFDLRRLH